MTQLPLLQTETSPHRVRQYDHDDADPLSARYTTSSRWKRSLVAVSTALAPKQLDRIALTCPASCPRSSPGIFLTALREIGAVARHGIDRTARARGPKAVGGLDLHCTTCTEMGFVMHIGFTQSCAVNPSMILTDQNDPDALLTHCSLRRGSVRAYNVRHYGRILSATPTEVLIID